jgi:sulfur carrier protein ThiS
VKVHIRNPDREVVVEGPKRVRDLLSELQIDPDTVLVIRDRTLVTREERLEDADRIEIRPVISGGSGEEAP